MIRSFATQATEAIFNGRGTKAARRTCPQNLWSIAGRKLDQLDSVELLGGPRIPPSGSCLGQACLMNLIKQVHGCRLGCEDTNGNMRE
jgi:hypothetical protein